MVRSSAVELLAAMLLLVAVGVALGCGGDAALSGGVDLDAVVLGLTFRNDLISHLSKH